MNIIIALDCAFGVFNNVPPRVDFGELDLQLMCDPQHFEIASYQDMLMRGTFPKFKMKTLDAFGRLFLVQAENSARFEHLEKGALSCWDMLVLAHSTYLASHCDSDISLTSRLSSLQICMVTTHL